tara:strand:+ start:5623 stop:5985 length:363 start_codon:yes stop_codon:yes gene_type:complete
MKYKKEVIGALSLLALDFMWLRFYMAAQYMKLVPKVQGSKLVTNIPYAIGAYSLMVVLMVNVVLKYNLSYIDTFIFGFCVYGVYDLTCGAIFQNWDLKLAILDMIWGGIVYTMAHYLAKQ